jgi:transcriptional regulator with XRE-family HTH domain
MQAHSVLRAEPQKFDPYTAAMARKPTRPRPRQGAKLAALRRAAGLSQTELGRLVGETQQNIAFWEQSDKPPRSDVIPNLAKILGVRIEDLLNADVPAPTRKGGPVGKVQRVFEEVSGLPRKQQEKVVEVVSAMVQQYKQRRAG